jgi:hypothetical protein
LRVGQTKPLRKVVQIPSEGLFVEEHNAKMPHSAFAGQTPDEMYFGTAKNLPDQLVVARAKARERRLAVNRAVSCHRCAPPPDDTSAPPPNPP